MRTSSLLLLTLILATHGAFAQEPAQEPWMKYMLPGEDHELLQPYEGEWTEEISMWMAADGEPQKFQLGCSMRMALEGRFLEMAHSGLLSGMPFGGLTMLGHNNASDRFELMSISNMGTGILELQGPWKEKGRTIELLGEMASPVGDGTIKVRQLITLVDKDTLLIENFDTYPGSAEYRSIAYRFTRKK
ncbi:MAG: DUF1579 family protein [Flavobacteriales bacterium]